MRELKSKVYSKNQIEVKARLDHSFVPSLLLKLSFNLKAQLEISKDNQQLFSLMSIKV